MKIFYDFDCHCSIEGVRLDVPEDATQEEIEYAILQDVIDRYRCELSWAKSLSLDEQIESSKEKAVKKSTGTGEKDKER